MSDLIRKSDALAAVQEWIYCCDAEEAIAALPAVTVGVKPLVWSQTYNNAGDLTDVWCADDPLFEHRWWAERADKMPKIEAKRTARILAALEPVAAPDLTDPVVVHANMLRGTIAKPTVEQIIHLYGVDALTKALASIEYERKVAQMREDFPNGI